MSDASTINRDAKLAAQVIDAYSSGLDGLTADECRDLNIADSQCKTLRDVLKTGPEGEVTTDERAKLAASGFSDDFIKTLAGDDGKNALRNRVRWLADHAVKKWWRIDASDEERGGMILEIGKLGPNARDTLPALIVALRGCHNVLCSVITFALNEIAPDAEEAIPALTEELKYNHHDMQWDAAYVLGKVGKVAVPALTRVLRDGDKNARYLAVKALGEIGKDAVPALIMALNDSDYDVLFGAVEVLSRIGPDAKDAVPALIVILKDIHFRMRLRANVADALDRIIPDAKKAMPELIVALKDYHTELAEHVNTAYAQHLDGLTQDYCQMLAIDYAQCETLKEVLKTGPEGEITNDERTKLAKSGFSEDFIKTLAGDDGKKALHNRVKWLVGYTLKWWNYNVRNSMESRCLGISEIGYYGPDAKDAVPALIVMLGENSVYVCQKVAKSLGNIGKSAKIAIPHLLNIEVNDPDPKCRAAAKEAREKIEAEIL